MKRSILLLLLILCAAISFPTPARADGGGWPTATPTVTPTSTPTNTPLAPTPVVATPTATAPYPAPNTDSGTMITPPVLTPLTDPFGAALTATAAPDTESSAKTEQSLSLNGGATCWPLAIVALLVGMALFSWLRSANRKKSHSS